jgi:hypothetical protein
MACGACQDLEAKTAEHSPRVYYYSVSAAATVDLNHHRADERGAGELDDRRVVPPIFDLDSELK